MEIPGPGSERVAELRRAFDQAFAAPVAQDPQEVESLLALGFEGDRYGLKVREITGVAETGKLVPLPSRSPGFLGLAGVRGAIVPVYSLALLLGYPRAGATLGLLALAGTKDPVALALGASEGYLRVPKTAFRAPDRSSRRHVRQIVETAEGVRAVLSVPSLVQAIQEEGAPESGGIAR